MCNSNGPQRVCRSKIDHLKQPSTRVMFGDPCIRAAWQVVIQYQLAPHEAGKSMDHMDVLSRRMHLKQPDGSPWSAEWDLLVIPKVTRLLQAKARQAVQLGIVQETSQGRRVWTDWSRGFISDAWDGHCFDEAYGRRLLAEMGVEDAPVHVGRQERAETAITISSSDSERIEAVEDEIFREHNNENDGPDPLLSGAGNDNGGEDVEEEEEHPNPNDLLPPRPNDGSLLSLDAETLRPEDSMSHLDRPAVRVRVDRLKSHGKIRTLATIPEDGAPAGHGEDDEDEDEDEDGDVRFWSSQSLRSLYDIVKQGAMQLLQFRAFLASTSFSTAALEHDTEVERALAGVLAQRDELLEQLCFVDDLIDKKLRHSEDEDEGQYEDEEAIREAFGFVHYPLTGRIWSFFLLSLEASPLLEARAERTRAEMGMGN